MHVTVVGAGVVGLLSAIECVLAGHRVTVVEQGDIPHPGATSADRHRILRALHTGDEATTEAAVRAHRRWLELERLLSADLYRRVGALTVLPPQEPGGATELLRRAGAPARALTEAELAAAYPHLRFPPGAGAVLERDAGVLLAERVLAACASWLRDRPEVELRPRHRVVRIDGTTVVVECGEHDLPAHGSGIPGSTGRAVDRLPADGVIVAAGPWSRRLLPPAAAAELTLWRQSMLYCDAPPERAAWEGMPAMPSLGRADGAWLVPPVAGTPLKLTAATACRPASALPAGTPEDTDTPHPGGLASAVTDRATGDHWRKGLVRTFREIIPGFDASWVTAARDCHYLGHATARGPVVVELGEGAVCLAACGGVSFKFAPLIARLLVRRRHRPRPATRNTHRPGNAVGNGRRPTVKLLGLEAVQNASYYRSRYEQIAALGADLHVLNGEGTADFWPADRYRIAGSKRIDDLIAHAKAWHAEARFDGVLTFSESAVVSVAAVAEALGLPGIGVQAAVTSRNKLLMRRAHERAGVPRPAFRFVGDLDAALAAAAEFGYPVILKPTLGAASNFVFRVDTTDELRERYRLAREGIDRMPWYAMEGDGLDLGPHGLLVESFLDGHEHLIEALAWDDEVYLGSIVDRVTVEGDTFDDDVHHAPTSLTPDQVAEVHDVVRRGVRAQGIRRSALHAEIRFHEERPHLLEIAVRPGGGGLDHMARLSAGYDPIRAVLDVARGVRPPVEHYHPTDVHTAAMCLLCPAGRIEQVRVPSEVQQDPRLVFVKITARPGDLIRRPPDGNNILGFLGATGSSFDDAMSTATELAGRIDVTLAARP